ncbi:MAG: DNA polymerase IV [Deltaproteobacteria bacterium]|nr:MAG: DNA polymerase IV [Deltaproteobacteria bacterium]
MNRSIIHLDLDAFYASVEMLDDPALRGKPVIVGGSERRGVVAASSYEARKFGVHSAMPTATAMRLCPAGVFLPVRMDRYRDMSEKVFDIFRRFTPLVEPLSIDEAFLDVTGCERLFGSAEETARRIRAAVRGETGLTVSAGVAPNKFLAKIASDVGKPDGLTVVPPGSEIAFLAPLPVGKLWGVGKVTEKEMLRRGIRTIGDLGRVPERELERAFGAQGMHLHRLAHGIDDRPVETEREAKSIGHEDTYDRDLRERGAIRRELLSLSDRVSARLRRSGVKGRTITLKVKYHDFVQVTRAATLADPTDDGGTLYRVALDLLGDTEAGARPVRLLGISVSKLSPAAGERKGDRLEQLSLFRPPGGGKRPPAGSADPEKKERLNRAVDRIREKFGRKGIAPGALPDDGEPGG